MVTHRYIVSGTDKVADVRKQLSDVIIGTNSVVNLTGEWQPDEFNRHRNTVDPDQTRTFELHYFVIVLQAGLFFFTAEDLLTGDRVRVEAFDDSISVAVTR